MRSSTIAQYQRENRCEYDNRTIFNFNLLMRKAFWDFHYWFFLLASLIHAGSGGIGLAAIRVALAYGMEVYTTVSTEQKKKFVLEQYPQLKGEETFFRPTSSPFPYL